MHCVQLGLDSSHWVVLTWVSRQLMIKAWGIDLDSPELTVPTPTAGLPMSFSVPVCSSIWRFVLWHHGVGDVVDLGRR